MNLSKLTLLFIFLCSTSAVMARGIPIPYGESEELVLVEELPDTEAFLLEDGTYFDLGQKYTISHIVWLAYSNTEPEYVGYANDGESYLDLSQEQLLNIVQESGITLPDELKPTFFHRIGGKIVLGIIGLFILYSIYSNYFGKDDEDEAIASESENEEE